jgi:hypothetical protein
MTITAVEVRLAWGVLVILAFVSYPGMPVGRICWGTLLLPFLPGQQYDPECRRGTAQWRR